MNTSRRTPTTEARLTLNPNREVTGRDWFILVRALSYARAAIRSLPPPLREESDCEDMDRIFEALIPNPDQRAALEQTVFTNFVQRRGAVLGSDST
jgi:hypothetical protein